MTPPRSSSRLAIARRVLQGPLLKAQQLPFVLDLDVKFQPFMPVQAYLCNGLFACYHPRRSHRHDKGSKAITHGDIRYLPGYM